MEKVKKKLRLLYLLPLATLICFGRLLKDKWLRIFITILMIGIVFCLCIPFFPDEEAQAVEPELASDIGSASPEPIPDTSTTTSTPSGPVTITLSFAGDCTLGMDQSFYYDSSFNAMYNQEGAAYFFQNVKSIFENDDLTVINFEGTLTESLDRADKDWAFKGAFEYVNALTEGSVEAANLANNHSCDYGYRSFTDTQETLEAAGIATFGYDDMEILDVKGVKVGLIGMYTVYENEGYIAQLKSYIRKLQENGAELIIANFHWGVENSAQPEDYQIQLAHAAIDAGAHLVIGHHPHILQGVEEYNGRYIVYSLGNFCFGGNSDPPDYDTMIFQQTFTVDKGTVSEDAPAKIIPCSVSSVSWKNDYCPTPATEDEAARIMEKLSVRSADLGTTNAILSISQP